MQVLRRLSALSRSLHSTEALSCCLPEMESLRALYGLHLVHHMSSMYKKQANEVRAGNILDVNGKLMQVVKSTHTHGAGRQLGNVSLEMRDITSKSKHPLKLRPGDSVNVVHLEERKFQYLYPEGDSLHCMDPSTFEQVALPRDALGDACSYLAEGAELTLCFHDGAPVSAELPGTVKIKVVEAAPHLKGETATPQYKPAVVESGASVQVPPFINSGDVIIVDTATGAFIKRAS